MSGTITYKRYPTNDSRSTLPLKDEGNRLSFELPNQPPAGKLTYYLNLKIKGQEQKIASEQEPIFIRYKGDVPTLILAPHIFFMFLSIIALIWSTANGNNCSKRTTATSFLPNSARFAIIS